MKIRYEIKEKDKIKATLSLAVPASENWGAGFEQINKKICLGDNWGGMSTPVHPVAPPLNLYCHYLITSGHRTKGDVTQDNF